MTSKTKADHPERFDGKKIELTEEEWKRRLTPEKFQVLRGEATECPFRNAYHAHTEKGWYACAGCGLGLFRAEAKFHSGSGWPSFWEPFFPENVTYLEDRKLLVPRIEVRCSRCGGHLGHLFDDGPLPTGKRYCINSESLIFHPQ